MNYLISRLSEAGTMRSLAVVCFALKGIIPDEATLQSFVNVAILMLGVISAMMTEKKDVTVTAVASPNVAVSIEKEKV